MTLPVALKGKKSGRSSVKYRNSKFNECHVQKMQTFEEITGKPAMIIRLCFKLTNRKYHIKMPAI